MYFKKIVASISLLFLCVGITFAQSSLELKKQREKIDSEIAELQKIIRAKTQEKLLSQKEVSALSRQLDLREDKISTINSELRVLNNQISKNNQAVSSLKAELEKMRKDYEKMILFAFRNKNAYNKMMFIFASKDFNQGFKRVKYLQQFNDARKVKAGEIEKTQKEIELKIAQLERDKQTQNALLKEQQAERAVIAKDRSEHSRELNQLAKEERTFRGQLTKKQQELKRLDAAIKNAVRREVEAARRAEEERVRRLAEAEARRTGKTVEEAEKTVEKKTGSAVLNATPEATKLSADFKANRGGLPWPVSQGNIVARYGMNTVERGVRVFNDYITIRTGDSAPVKAVFSGTVTVAIMMGGTGAVAVQHGEFFTVYSNLKSISVSKGQKVSTGQSVGVAGENSDLGFSTIDLTIYQGTNAVNPEIWIGK
ncbi:peptidase M23 [Sphingobacterium sp. KB22]|uniref:Peptidase M23 n=1 Tax=Sphingobacterium hungaricum TaxID=2082723 RepID=A0A928YQW6_9SPHI|nr:peptidase M23 [Sphingobacterium hungaricum]